jgi:hypothetical protein
VRRRRVDVGVPSAWCEVAAAGNRASGVRTGDVRDVVMLLLDMLKLLFLLCFKVK